MNGAQGLFKALVDAGVDTCFANPGTSEMQLVYEMGRTQAIRPVLCLQEDVVTGAADGYGRMREAPAAALLHVACGFANGIAMLHNAARAGTPLVAIAGTNASYHQGNYPEHELVNGRVQDLAGAVSHWCREARSASHLAELGVEAAALAKSGKVCTIVAPNDRHWEEATPPPGPPPSAARPLASADAIARAAELIANGRRTGLVLGGLALHGEALELAGRIAARTGIALLAETFPTGRLERGEGRPPVDLIPYEFEIGVKFLEPFDQLIFVGAGLPVATFAYHNKPTLKSRTDCELYRAASADQDLGDALRRLAEATGARQTPPLLQDRRDEEPAAGALTAEAIGRTLGSLMPTGSVLIDEGNTNGPPILAATKGARAHDYLSAATGGAIGGGLPMALGAAIARPDRKVVAVEADGSGMYAVQALWSIAREGADVVTIVLKNDAYAILGLELARVRDGDPNSKMKSMLDLDGPSIDWVGLAEGLGVPADRARTAEEFTRLFEAAVAEKGPRLIECQVARAEEWGELEEQIYRSR